MNSLRAGQTILVRYDWRWEDDNKWMGRWLEERATVVEVGDLALTLKTHEGELKIVPFTAFRQLVVSPNP